MSPTMPQQSLSFKLASEKINRRVSYKGKGKERAVDDSHEPPSPSLYTFVPRPPSISGLSSMSDGISAPTSPSSKRSSILSIASSSSSRSSALFELSPFKFGRKKKSPPRQNPNLRMNLILPGVLEISAANSVSTPAGGEDINPIEDEEARERVRLREEAVQALGLASSTISHQSHSDDYSESGHSLASNGTLRHEGVNNVDHAPNNQIRSSPLTSTTSLHPPSLPQTHINGRNRSGSMPAALPSLPTTPQSLQQAPDSQVTPVPPFPSTPRALGSFKQTTSSGTLPKYYPSSSLRIFALSKQWKARYLILTSPADSNSASVARDSAPHVQVSYLHLFKSSSPDERELERLEINEDSVVFVSEEEVGARKGVVQVAGINVGFVGDGKRDSGKERELVQSKEQATWLFYIADPLEKQRWIENIKNKVFGQRTVRAGLGSSPPPSGLVNEPRGDMDVMMSMRAQGIITSGTPPPHTSPTRSAFSIQEIGYGHAISSTIPTSGGHDAASVSSAKSNKNTRPGSPQNKHASTGGVLSLRGLFGSSRTSVGHTSGRPRSSSRTSGTEEVEYLSPSIREAKVERTDSVVSMGSAGSVKSGLGNNLISILRSSSPPTERNKFGSIAHGSGANLSMGVRAPAVDFATLGVSPPPAQIRSQLDRKILQSPLVREEKTDGSSTTRSLLLSKDATVVPSDQNTRTSTFSVDEAFSLQPPPRKRWTSTSEMHTPPALNSPQSRLLQLQDSPYIRDHRALDELDVLGGAPSIGRVNTGGNGSLTPEPMLSSSPATKRASGQSTYSFSFGTPPGSGNLDVEYRPRSVSSRSARSARSGQSGRSVDTAEEEEEMDGHSSPSGRVRRPSDESGFGSFPESDKRASVNSGKRNSAGGTPGKRWSRQLPKRLTPPSGPPPAAPTSPSPGSPNSIPSSSSPVRSLPKATQVHPYSAAATERRASTLTRSNSSRSSVASNFPSFSKRASVSSAVSALSTNSTQMPGSATAGTQTPASGISGHTRASSSHRSSMAPPPRPAPTFALPPAPGGETSPSPVPSPLVSAPAPSIHNSSTSSFRESIASRAFRLSLMAPKPPPSDVLPPRPDEQLEYPKSPTSSVSSRHRRSHSGNNPSGGPSSLYSIPGSPVAPPSVPSGEILAGGLPITSITQSSTPSRGSSIKQRLRILSAPSSSPPIPPRSSARPTTPMTVKPAASAPSPPGTPTVTNTSPGPYFEKQSYELNFNSNSFQSLTPTSPSIPAPKVHILENEPNLEPELTSLSPPPRRGSKRISLPEVEAPPSIQEGESTYSAQLASSVEDNDPDFNANDANTKPFSLSRHGSVISLGIVNA